VTAAPVWPDAAPETKRAALVADRIVEDVMAMGWPVGEVLGSETELLARYGVSRAVFREAVRLVEHQQVARTRRGPGGGLVVTEPTVDAVIDAVVLYLHRVDARLDEVFEARVVLEEIVTTFAPSRIDESDLARLRALVDQEASGALTDPRALHSMLASMTRNPALELFVEVLNRVSRLYSRGWPARERMAQDSLHAHSRLAEAVTAGNVGLARHRMRVHLEAEGEFLRGRRSTRQLLPDAVVLGPANGGKRAEVLARQVTYHVVVGGREPGELIGSEAELMQRHDVSRAVLRESVRILEHHHVAAMRRGPRGGLFVVEPSAAPVIDMVAVYLARRGLRLADFIELRIELELALVDLAVERIDADGTARLDDALSRELDARDADMAEAVHDLHAVTAAIARNRVLELVSLVLIRLSRLHHIEKLAPRAREQVRQDVHRTHEGIARAIAAGDKELARHRMRRHLEALGRLMR
jgi:DNA-binding FadR family transcriptional regulator